MSSKYSHRSKDITAKHCLTHFKGHQPVIVRLALNLFTSNHQQSNPPIPSKRPHIDASHKWRRMLFHLPSTGACNCTPKDALIIVFQRAMVKGCKGATISNVHRKKGSWLTTLFISQASDTCPSSPHAKPPSSNDARPAS